jgi:hypothetical protein
MALKSEMLDELLKGGKTPEDVDSRHAQLLQRMINRAPENGLTANACSVCAC